ncbi:MAG TPA: aminopeptidase N [Burkholderiales bacterium]
MREPTPQVIHLKDYTPPAFLIDTVALDIDMRDDHALVIATLAVRRNQAANEPNAPLCLDGDELTLESVAIDRRVLAHSEYEADAQQLVIAKTPDTFTLETVCRIEPQKNTQLMGLYASKNGYFTQCEAQGFRRITYFLDRPDVMARYTTTIHADKARYPVLLSNGNRTAHGDEPGNRHWATWTDPFPKPSYLFAMVAAKLDKLEDTFVTLSGKTARLAIFVEPGKLDQCAFAMAALKRAMKWDEEVFGLELDLDGYMIVAVGDFNMGAMENKGLNVFNTKYVLARPDSATDMDFMNIDRVVGHEYFHNWTGNRVTCRDWFQLSLKEGLTVFRDQEFGADMYSRPVMRIQEVRGLRAAQFPEDAGPMAHPIRPTSYMEISNFYTPTVYEKGAEVVRMIHTLIGKDAFRRGMDLYFRRHDGEAVTTDEFVNAMADASQVDLTQFKRWYDQAGTPVLETSGTYDAAKQTYTLTVRQSCPPTPGQPDKQPFHIPFALGLVGPDGNDIPLQLKGEDAARGTGRVLSATKPEERYTFINVPAQPVPSLLRGFSAPVILRHEYSEAELTHLMAHDSDAFNRWEAGQRLATRILLRGVETLRVGSALDVPASFIDAFARVLSDAKADPAFAAEALSLPSEAFLGEQMNVIEPDAIHTVRVAVRARIAAALKAQLLETYRAHTPHGGYSPDAKSAGERALRNLCLGYLMELNDAPMRALCVNQFEAADNMTDAIAALSALANVDAPERQTALDHFYAKWQDEALVVDKWLGVQSTSRLRDTLPRVRELMAHPGFSIRNPNKVYALIGGFRANQVHFHAADGSGYRFLAEQVIALDRLNPQVAARMARGFDRWKKFDAGRQAHARAALESIRDTANLSKDVCEIVIRSLA